MRSVHIMSHDQIERLTLTLCYDRGFAGSPDNINKLTTVTESRGDGGEGSHYLAKLRSSLGEYQTTEAKLLQEFQPTTGEISRDEGLRLVLESCDKLEQQVSSLYDQPGLEVLEAKFDASY